MLVYLSISILILILFFSSQLDKCFSLSLGKVWSPGATCPEGVLSRWWWGYAKTSFCRAGWEPCALLHINGVCFVLCMRITSNILSCYIYHIYPRRRASSPSSNPQCVHIMSHEIFPSKDAKPTWDDHPGYSWGRQSAGVYVGPTNQRQLFFIFFPDTVCLYRFLIEGLRHSLCSIPFWKFDYCNLFQFVWNHQPDLVCWLKGARHRSQVVFSMKPTVECVSAKESGCSWSRDELFDVKIPDGVTQIGCSAFKDCHSLVRVTIPDSVTKIQDFTFAGCMALTSLTIPNSVTEIGSYAFYGCLSLTSLTIPNSVTSFGQSAFESCSSLTSVVIPQSVTDVEAVAFAYCSGLTSVTIPGSVTRIGGYAFCGCSSLMSVNIPDSVAQIGRSAFENCSSLKSVRIPHSVTHIGPSAFEGCSSLTSVVIMNVQTCIAINAFYGCRGLPFFLRVKRQRASRTCVAVGQKKGFRLIALLISVTKTHEPKRLNRGSLSPRAWLICRVYSCWMRKETGISAKFGYGSGIVHCFALWQQILGDDIFLRLTPEARSRSKIFRAFSTSDTVLVGKMFEVFISM